MKCSISELKTIYLLANMRWIGTKHTSGEDSPYTRIKRDLKDIAKEKKKRTWNLLYMNWEQRDLKLKDWSTGGRHSTVVCLGIEIKGTKTKNYSLVVVFILFCFTTECNGFGEEGTYQLISMRYNQLNRMYRRTRFSLKWNKKIWETQNYADFLRYLPSPMSII